MTEIPSFIEEKLWKKEYPKNIPHEISIPDSTLVDLINEKMEEYKNRTAFIFRGEETTHGENHRKARTLASALIDLGVKKGDRVGIYMSNSPDWLISYHGVMKTGAIITGVNPLYVPREVKHQLNDSRTETVILHERYYPNLEEILEETNVKRIILANLEGEEPSIEREEGIYYLQNLLEDYEPEFPEVDMKPDDVLVLQYTGGTTGRPKGCMLTHRNMVANVLQNEVWNDYVCEQAGLNYLTGVSMLPWYHIFGQT